MAKNKKGVIACENAEGELCAMNLDDFDHAKITQIQDMYIIDIFNDHDKSINYFIITAELQLMLHQSFIKYLNLKKVVNAKEKDNGKNKEKKEKK